MSKRRFLITGGSGKFGAALRGLIEGDAPSHAELDILRPADWERPLARGGYDAVLHLAGISAAGYAQKHPAEAFRTNVIGTRWGAEAAARHKVKFVYISTDYVFEGARGDYREEDPPSPPNWYGATKYAGELEILNAGGPHLIVRTSFRPSDWGFPTAYTNVFTSADYTDVIAKELAACLAIDPFGIIHVGTPVKSFYELASRRNPDVKPEECSDPTFPKRRHLNIDRWLSLRKGVLCES